MNSLAREFGGSVDRRADSKKHSAVNCQTAEQLEAHCCSECYDCQIDAVDCSAVLRETALSAHPFERSALECLEVEELQLPSSRSWKRVAYSKVESWISTMKQQSCYSCRVLE